MGRKATLVVLVRHGERLDEADRFAWQQMRTHETQYDPPLTKTGYKQSSLAAKKVLQQLANSGAPPVTTIYSSPTARTLGTAAAMAQEVGVSRVLPAYGLNCCAAAKMTGVASKYWGPPTEGTMRGVACSWPPLQDAKEVNQRNRSERGFVQSLQELASAHGEESVIMVSHREGIWEVLQHFGRRPHKEYCSTHYLWYDHDSQKLTLWDPDKDPAESDAAGPRSGAKTATTDLGAILAKGQGRLALKGTHGRKLWQTPGVRDLWVEGGEIHPGEVIELCSSPQASEGDEGDFVLVRKENGIEGWTKVRNLSSAVLPEAIECRRMAGRMVPEALKALAN